jgi:hypothetical protein
MPKVADADLEPPRPVNVNKGEPWLAAVLALVEELPEDDAEAVEVVLVLVAVELPVDAVELVEAAPVVGEVELPVEVVLAVEVVPEPEFLSEDLSLDC